MGSSVNAQQYYLHKQYYYHLMGSQLCPGSHEDSSSMSDEPHNQQGIENHQQIGQKISCKSTEITYHLEKHIETHYHESNQQHLPNQSDQAQFKRKIQKIIPENEIIEVKIEKEYSQFQLSDKTIFKGITINGIPNGFGEEHHHHGEIFMGNFVNGEKNGYGKYKFANSEQYDGDFLNNMMHGKGTYLFKNGDKYIGDFENNHREGFGRYIPKQPNQHKIEYFEGQYKQNERNGGGFIRYTTGQQFKGFWKHGLLIRAK